MSWNLQQHSIGLASLLIKEEFPLQHFNNASGLFEVKRTAVKFSLLSKPPKNYWSFMKLHTLATNSCFDWLTCNRIQSCLEQNVQRPRYESETLDKCQWCTQALFQTLWQDIFGRLVVQNSLARYLVLNTYTFERRDIHSILSS